MNRIYFCNRLLLANCSVSTKQLQINTSGRPLLDSQHSTGRTYVSSTNQMLSNHEWSTILSKAEKIVGYPTSFLSLRYLVSDEVAHFANLLRKLMKTKHPLIKMARRFLTSNDIDTKRSLQINGLIVLLISKAAGIPRHKYTAIIEGDLSDGIHNSQRAVAEIAEMIYMGTVIHRGVLDLRAVDSPELKQMDQGNKLAVLLGDYLLASACKNLAKLHNNEVVGLMSQVIADISQGMFEQRFDNTQNKMNYLNLWYDNINSNSSSLLANSAKAAVLLVRHSVVLQDLVFNFAENLDVTHKIWSDVTEFTKLIGSDRSIGFANFLKNKPDNLINAIYKDKYYSLDRQEAATMSSTSEFYETVLNDSKLLFDHHYVQALQILAQIEQEPNAEPNAIGSLRSILNVMKSSI